MTRTDAKITLRYAREERERWEAAAKMYDRTLSSWMRWVLNREADRVVTQLADHPSRKP